jgi:hypothetical protein
VHRLRIILAGKGNDLVLADGERTAKIDSARLVVLQEAIGRWVEKTSNIKVAALVSVHSTTCGMMPDNQWLDDILDTVAPA